LLQGLIGILDVAEFGRERDPGDHGLDTLALAILEQAAEVDPAPGALSLVAELGLEGRGVDPKPFEDLGRQFGGEGLVHTLDTNKAPGRFRRI
jgi:hypothetical protein